jgi:hypothetical protein
MKRLLCWRFSVSVQWSASAGKDARLLRSEFSFCHFPEWALKGPIFNSKGRNKSLPIDLNHCEILNDISGLHALEQWGEINGRRNNVKTESEREPGG